MPPLSASDIVWLLLAVLLPLLAGAAGWAGWRALRYRRLPHTLATSARLVAWGPALAGGAVAALVMVAGDRASQGVFGPDRVVEALVPLIAGMQAAFVFSPDDEPGLEVLLACPRPLAWTVVERLLVLLAWQGGVALLSGLAASWRVGGSALESVARWLPPLLLLTATALALTLSTRQPLFSVGLTLLLWFGMLWNSSAGGDGLLARWPYLWPLHLYLQPGHSDYWLNRAGLLLASANLVALSAGHLLRDEERVLLGGRTVTRRVERPQGEA